MRAPFIALARVWLLGSACAVCTAGEPASVPAPSLAVEVLDAAHAGPSSFKDRLVRELIQGLERSGCVRPTGADGAQAESSFKLTVAIGQVQEEVEFDRTLAERAGGNPEGRGQTTARIEATLEARLARGPTTIRTKRFRGRGEHTQHQFEDPREAASREIHERLAADLRSWTCKGVASAAK